VTNRGVGVFVSLLCVGGCLFPCYQGVQRVTNSVVWVCWALVNGIWNNGPLAFAASMSVLFTLYKVHRGEWVLLSEVTSTHVTDICTGFVAWMRKTPGTNSEKVPFIVTQYRKITRALTFQNFSPGRVEDRAVSCNVAVAAATLLLRPLLDF
jgi:hypothetical protein